MAKKDKSEKIQATEKRSKKDKGTKGEKKDRSSKKSKGEKPTKVQGTEGVDCAFVMRTEDLSTALTRINAMLNSEGIPISDQFVIFNTLNGDLRITAGIQGAYVEAVTHATISERGWFATCIALPWIDYNDAEVEFTFTATSKSVSYSNLKRNFSGNFAVKNDAALDILENKIKRPQDVMVLSFDTLFKAVSTALINVDTLDENPDILLYASVLKLDGNVNDEDEAPKKPKRSSDKSEAGVSQTQNTHLLRVAVFDRARAAIVGQPCVADREFFVAREQDTIVEAAPEENVTKKGKQRKTPKTTIVKTTVRKPVAFASSHMWAFLQKCLPDERKGNVTFGLDADNVWLSTDKFISVSGSIESALDDMTETFISVFKEEDALFRMTLDTSSALSAFSSVLSVSGGVRTKLVGGSDPTGARISMTLADDGNLRIAVSSALGSASAQIKPVKCSGKGTVDINGTWLIEPMSLVDPAAIEITVWEKLVRQRVCGAFLKEHYYATMINR